MDLIPLLIKEKVSLDGEIKKNMVQQMHEKVQLQNEKKNKLYAFQANKGYK
jgi:hypothetical protein